MNSLIHLKQTTSVFLVAFGLTCFVLSARAQEIASSPTPAPSPDGGYPGNNTAEGFNALLSITTGGSNTAVGSGALMGDSTGNDNTAIGTLALQHNANSAYCGSTESERTA